MEGLRDGPFQPCSVPWGGGAGGGNRTPTGLTTLRIFVPLRLSPPARPKAAVRGLDYPFTMTGDRERITDVRRCPSSLYTFRSEPGGRDGTAWLGITRKKASPNLSSSASPVSRASTRVFGSSPLRLPVSPRPQAPPTRRIAGAAPTPKRESAPGENRPMVENRPPRFRDQTFRRARISLPGLK
jgi:hypothetical protein